MPETPRRIAYRTLASIVDITTGDEQQTLRILGGVDTQDPITDLEQVRPRIDCAQRWVDTYMPAEQHTRVLTEPDTDRLSRLDETEQQMIKTLLARLTDEWSLDGLTTLVYGVPKLMAGLPVDTPPTPELKVAQRAFFVLLYQLLVGGETGPRLPTLLLAVGADRVRTLVGG